MSWRFKASKYKNAAPIEQKKELQLRNLSIGSFTGKNVSIVLPRNNFENCPPSIDEGPLLSLNDPVD